jgi:hypothetical protein
MAGPYFYTPYIWPMLVSAIFSAALGVYAWRHRTVPGAAAFAIQELFTHYPTRADSRSAEVNLASWRI